MDSKDRQLAFYQTFVDEILSGEDFDPKRAYDKFLDRLNEMKGEEDETERVCLGD